MNVKLPLFLVRQNSVPYAHALQFGSNELRDLMQQYRISLQSQDKKIISFITKLEHVIKLVEDDQQRKELINLKRDMFNLRFRFCQRIEQCQPMLEDFKLIREAEDIRSLYQQNKARLIEIEHQFNYAKSHERAQLYDVFQKEETLMNSLKFIQATIMEKARGYFNTPVQEHGVKHRKLDYTLLKVLTRATHKTSPFSTLTKVGVGQFSNSDLVSSTDPGETYTVTNLNLAYLMRVFEAIRLRPSMVSTMTYHFNETLTRHEGKFYWTTLADQPMKRKKIYRTADTLMKIKENPLLLQLYKELGSEPFTYDRVENVFLHNGLGQEKAVTYALSLIKNDFLQPTQGIPEHTNKGLDYILSCLSEAEVLNTDEVLRQVFVHLKTIKEVLNTFDEMHGQASYQSYQEIVSHFKEVTKHLGIPDLDEKLLLYQDYLTTERRIEPQENWEQIDRSLKLFQQSTILFDVVLRLQYVLGKFMLDKYGHERVAFRDNEKEDVMEIMLNAIMDNAGHLWSGQFNETAIDSEIEEVRMLDAAKNEFIRYLKAEEQLNKGSEIRIPSDYLQELISTLPRDLERYTQSNSFFVQRTDENSFVLNDMYGGYLSYFSRFLFNLEDVMKEPALQSYVHQHIKERNVVDIYKSYGFNANVRSSITDYSVHIPNSRVADESGLTGVYDWQDLELQYNPITKKIDVFAKGEQVHILFLGSLMTRLIPSISAMLHALSANGVLFKSVGSILIDEYLAIPREQPTIKHFPRISLDGTLVLSRECWVIDTQLLTEYSDKNYLSMMNFLSLLDSHGIPHRVFFQSLKSLDGTEEDTDTIDGAFEKPQYVNFTSPLLWSLFLKEVKDTPYFLLTEVLPDLRESDQEYTEEYLLELTSKGALQ